MEKKPIIVMTNKIIPTIIAIKVFINVPLDSGTNL